MPAGHDKVPFEHKALIILVVVAIALLLVGCGGDPSILPSPLEADGGEWQLTSLGEGRNLDFHPAPGEKILAETTLILTVPALTYARVSLTFWAREGSSSADLAPISSLDQASIVAYNIYGDRDALLASPFITDSLCSTTQERGRHICDEDVIIPQGQTRLVLGALIVSDGRPHVYTFGISEMRLCDATRQHCRSVSVSPALIYQAGANVGQQTPITTFTVTPRP